MCDEQATELLFTHDSICCSTKEQLATLTQSLSTSACKRKKKKFLNTLRRKKKTCMQFSDSYTHTQIVTQSYFLAFISWFLI